MTELLTAPKKEARKRGWIALGGLIIGSGLLLADCTKTGAVILVLTIWLVGRWLTYRGKWGLKF